MQNTNNTNIMIGWTTVSSQEDAEKIVKKLLELNLIACGQINGPISSHYKWDGEMHNEQEWRVTVKYAHKQIDETSRKLLAIHPYDTPQWTTVEATTNRKYGEWVNCS